MVWSEGNMSLKNPVTPPGIDPGTVRLVAQRLNHYTAPGPDFSQLLPETVPSLSLMWATAERRTPAGHRGGKTVQ